MWSVTYFVWYKYVVCGTMYCTEYELWCQECRDNFYTGSGQPASPCGTTYIIPMWGLCARNAGIIPVQEVVSRSLLYVWYNIQNMWRLGARNAGIIPVQEVAGLSSTCDTIYRICGCLGARMRGEFLSRKWPVSPLRVVQYTVQYMWR